MSLSVYHFVSYIGRVCSPSILIPFGLLLTGQDPDFLKINVEFTVEVVKAGKMINLFPDFLKPFVAPHTEMSNSSNMCDDRLAGRLVGNVPSYIDRSMKHLRPIIEERKRKMKEYGGDWDDKPASISSRDPVQRRDFMLICCTIALE